MDIYPGGGQEMGKKAEKSEFPKMVGINLVPLGDPLGLAFSKLGANVLYIYGACY